MEWNDKQIAIANALSEGKEYKDIVDDCETSLGLVYKVANALKKAKSSTTDKGNDVTPDKTNKALPQFLKVTDSAAETSVLEFAPRVQKFAMTPDIFMSYMYALKIGFVGGLGEWLSLVSRDFWLGRNCNFYAEVAGFNPQVKEEGNGNPN